jgi:hypothetical protein
MRAAGPAPIGTERAGAASAGRRRRPTSYGQAGCLSSSVATPTSGRTRRTSRCTVMNEATSSWGVPGSTAGSRAPSGAPGQALRRRRRPPTRPRTRTAPWVAVAAPAPSARRSREPASDGARPGLGRSGIAAVPATWVIRTALGVVAWCEQGDAGGWMRRGVTVRRRRVLPGGACHDHHTAPASPSPGAPVLGRRAGAGRPVDAASPARRRRRNGGRRDAEQVGVAPRERAAAPPAPRPWPRRQASPADRRRSRAAGPPGRPAAHLGGRAGHRAPGNRAALASPGFLAVLAAEIARGGAHRGYRARRSTSSGRWRARTPCGAPTACAGSC